MLHTAIKRVARYVPKGSDSPDQYRAVRWIPAAELPYLGQTEGAWVIGYDGSIGVAVHVDTNLPNALLPCDGLVQAMASPVDRVIVGSESVAIESESGGTFQIPLMPVQGYPHPPVVSGWQPWAIWPNLASIVHCAASPKSGQPAFSHVCLRSSGAEVTDTVCVAIAPGWGWDPTVLVPARLFDARDRSKSAQLAIDDYHAVLRIGEGEYRWATPRRDMPYPDLREIVTRAEDKGGATVTLAGKPLLEAIRQAVSISASSAVACIFEPQRLGVLGWRGKGGSADHVYDATLPYAGGEAMGKRVTVYCDGKLLWRALRYADTPTLEVSYTTAQEPLRLAWGSVTELLWPWIL